MRPDRRRKEPDPGFVRPGRLPDTRASGLPEAASSDEGIEVRVEFDGVTGSRCVRIVRDHVHGADRVREETLGHISEPMT